jgi:hypothetical protein
MKPISMHRCAEWLYLSDQPGSFTIERSMKNPRRWILTVLAFYYTGEFSTPHEALEYARKILEEK